MSEFAFTEAERAAIYRAIAERRDMRIFVRARWTPPCCCDCCRPRTPRPAWG